jgi:uncharacterized protein (UPF0335 family)
VREGFATVREQFNIVHKDLRFLHERVEGLETESREFRKEAKSRFDDLEKGLFTEEEKEQIMAMVRHYDKWLVADTKGKERITLTREEYDAASRAQGFPNRFVGVPLIDIE